MRPLFSLAVLSVFSSGCVAPLCVTRNGLQFQGARDSYIVPESWSCSAIQEVEDGITSRLPQFKASGLQGYALTIVDPATDTDPWGRKVRGYTRCSTKEMVVWGYPVHPSFSSLGHETVHAMQQCAPRLPVDPGHDEDHADWQREGIDAAIAELTASSHP